MIAYKLGDIVDTTQGLKFVQCSLVLQGEWAGRVLHWFHNENGDDELLWDHELAAIVLNDLTQPDEHIPYIED